MDECHVSVIQTSQLSGLYYGFEEAQSYSDIYSLLYR